MSNGEGSRDWSWGDSGYLDGALYAIARMWAFILNKMGSPLSVLRVWLTFKRFCLAVEWVIKKIGKQG